MDWIFLLLAGLSEVVWAVGLKYTEGFSRLIPSIVTLSAMAASITLLGAAVRSIPIGTAYAIWTGVGCVGAAAFGIVVLGESAALLRLICVGLVVAGVCGLSLSSR